MSLLTLLTAVQLLASALASTDVLVYPTPTASCPLGLCLTLDSIAKSPIINDNYNENVTLLFLPGTHELSQNLERMSIHVQRGAILKIKAVSTRVTILCKNNSFIQLSGSGVIEFKGINFFDCSGPFGGVNINFIGTVIVTHCSFNSIEHGGFMSTSDQTILTNSEFSDSVVINSMKGRLTVDQCRFKGGFVSYAPRMHIKGVFALIFNSIFENIVIDGREGGAVSIASSDVLFNNVTFSNNIAPSCGAVYISNSSVEFSQASFIRNMGSYDAGALCAINSKLLLMNVLVAENAPIRDTWTGGVSLINSEAIFNKATFVSNAGDMSGALYLKSSLVQVKKGVFDSNRALNASGAGAVYAESSEVSFEDGTVFMGNIPSGRSRAVLTDHSHVTNCHTVSVFGLVSIMKCSAEAQIATLSAQCNSYEREKQNEGYKPCAYYDSPDPSHRKLTIGVGFNLERSGAHSAIASVGANYDRLMARTECLSDHQIQTLFNKDMASAVGCAQRFVGENWSRLGATRQSAVADMAFNLGCRKLGNFRKLKAALRSTPPDYREAAKQMRESLWCRQVKSRCPRTVACMVI